MLTGIWIWVWETAPDPHALQGFDGAIVRAANGNGHVANDGFDFRANFARWDATFPGRCVPWTWLYATTDGVAAADAILAAAPAATTFVIDVEGDDPSGQPVPARVIADFAAEIRTRRAGAQIGFSSYPLRAVAVSHGAPWDDLVDNSDFGLPQVYFPEQAARLAQVTADHRGKPMCVAFSPGDNPGWAAVAQGCFDAHGGVSLWRHPDTDNYRTALRAPTPAAPRTAWRDDMVIFHLPDGSEYLVSLGEDGNYKKRHLSPAEASAFFKVGMSPTTITQEEAAALGLA